MHTFCLQNGEKGGESLLSLCCVAGYRSVAADLRINFKGGFSQDDLPPH